MTDFSGLFPEVPSFTTIPAEGWADPTIREQYEAHFETPFGRYGYVFQSSQYGQIEAVNRLGTAVAMELNTEFNERRDSEFQSVCRRMFDNPGGTFSQGVILLGAVSRELAESYQRTFGLRINHALEALNANIRLAE